MLICLTTGRWNESNVNNFKIRDLIDTLTRWYLLPSENITGYVLADLRKKVFFTCYLYTLDSPVITLIDIVSNDRNKFSTPYPGIFLNFAYNLG